MKALTKWRFGVLYVLLLTGIMAVLFIFGDDERPMAQWIEVRIYLVAIAAVCFCTLGGLTKKWNREGKIGM